MKIVEINEACCTLINQLPRSSHNALLSFYCALISMSYDNSTEMTLDGGVYYHAKKI